MDTQPKIDIGAITITALSAGRVKMDGGAMFGVIPKPLWSKRITPDERNRVELGMRCLLVETANETILVETGFGGKVTEKLREIYGLDEDPGLLKELEQSGKGPEDIDSVILTHLHQDHAGGATLQSGSSYSPAFPNARYIVQSDEWQDAREADGQTVNAYRLEEVLDPLERSGQLDLVGGDTDLENGIHLIVTPGHTRAHQSILIEDGGDALFYVGDLVPTSLHLRPIYVMAYDLYPRETFFNKEQFLQRAADEGWWVVWPHDPKYAWGKIGRDDNANYIIVGGVESPV
ncbi:MAG: MBL fold metallo-hydrolase [Candidatus Latescibacterota bacterium]|nr:MBL fold metallo-hydrolase [Candidatus Latescibacterota bacterium]